MDVIIRGLNEELYRKLKAKASLRGCKISRALEEAITLWLELSEKDVQTEEDVNNELYTRMKNQLLEKHKGKYAVFCEGNFIGVADSLESASELVRARGAKKALIVKVGEEEPAGGEWLWSSTELSTV